jgi:type I restriction enzyme M protein
MRKSLGDKRREIPLDRAEEIVEILASFRAGEARPAGGDGEPDEAAVSRIYPTTHFGFRKITVERPLRLAFQASEERIRRLDDEKPFARLAESKRRGAAGAKEAAEGRALQEAIRALLRGMPGEAVTERDDFERLLGAAAKEVRVKIPAPVQKAILSVLSERDETAAICRDAAGNPEPDPELRDTESVPLSPGDDPADAEGVPASVRAYFEREVAPHVPDAWIDTNRRDPQDGKVGIVGYEINFNRYFYEYRPPRPLEEIEADIQQVEKEIMAMLREVAG